MKVLPLSGLEYDQIYFVVIQSLKIITKIKNVSQEQSQTNND